MTDTERDNFRASFSERNLKELMEAHNVRGNIVKAAREEQDVIHQLVTEKEEVAQRTASSGRAQVIGTGAIDDDQILSAFKGSPGLFERIKARLEGK